LLEIVEQYAREASAQQQTRRRLFAGDTVQGLGLLELAQKKFDVILMNPPFGAVSLSAKSEFEESYQRAKKDIYAAFVERGIGLLHPRGMLGAITSRTGFFLSSFQRWREEVLLTKAPPAVFADLGYGVLDGALVEVAAYCLEAAG
jgi:23S rRNA G2069 N7-methylase RlmK/C1962 C5-methylase RlmI